MAKVASVKNGQLIVEPMMIIHGHNSSIIRMHNKEASIAVDISIFYDEHSL